MNWVQATIVDDLLLLPNFNSKGDCGFFGSIFVYDLSAHGASSIAGMQPCGVFALPPESTEAIFGKLPYTPQTHERQFAPTQALLSLSLSVGEDYLVPLTVFSSAKYCDRRIVPWDDWGPRNLHPTFSKVRDIRV